MKELQHIKRGQTYGIDFTVGPNGNYVSTQTYVVPQTPL